MAKGFAKESLNNTIKSRNILYKTLKEEAYKTPPHNVSTKTINKGQFFIVA